MTIQIKATEQYFPVVLLIMLYMIVQTFESADEILKSVLAQLSFPLVSFSILYTMQISYFCRSSLALS